MPVTASSAIAAGEGDAVRAQAAWAGQDGHPGERKTNLNSQEENGNSIKERGAEVGKPLSNTGEWFPPLFQDHKLSRRQTKLPQTSFYSYKCSTPSP